jgi:hypothetical protein
VFLLFEIGLRKKNPVFFYPGSQKGQMDDCLKFCLELLLAAITIEDCLF